MNTEHLARVMHALLGNLNVPPSEKRWMALTPKGREYWLRLAERGERWLEEMSR